MWIEFSTEEQKGAVVDLPMKQRLPLVQGIPLLEETNQELLAIHQQAVIDYFIYNEKDQELATLKATLTLPVEGQTMVEAIQAPVWASEEVDSEDAKAFLALFEKSLPKDKRTQGIKRRKIGRNKEEKTAGQELTIQVPYTEGRMTVKFAPFLKIMCLFFFLLGAFYLGKTVPFPAKISDKGNAQWKALEKQVQQQPQIDTFSRYFLTNYYTGTTEKEKVQERINRFVDKGVVNDVQGTDKQVKSMLLWEAKRKGATWHLSYILTFQDRHEQTTTQQVSFSIKEQDQQYKVLTVPKEAPFEINH